MMQEVVETINNNEVIKFVGTLMGITGISLRELNVKKCYEKMKEVFQDAFTEEIIEEEEKKIFLNSLNELEKYLNENESLDSKLFENLLKTTVNGVKYKDELTKEYIKILKNMTFLDLKVFKAMFSKKTYILNKEESYIVDLGQRSCYSIIDNYREDLKDIPIQLIEKSLENLIKVKFIEDKTRGKKIKAKQQLELDFLTELGNKIMILIK